MDKVTQGGYVPHMAKASPPHYETGVAPQVWGQIGLCSKMLYIKKNLWIIKLLILFNKLETKINKPLSGWEKRKVHTN